MTVTRSFAFGISSYLVVWFRRVPPSSKHLAAGIRGVRGAPHIQASSESILTYRGPDRA
jgi:hypothetical protein